MRFSFAASCIDHSEIEFLTTFGLPSITLKNWQTEDAPDRPDIPYRHVPTHGINAGTQGFTDPPAGTARGTYFAGNFGFASSINWVLFVIDDKVYRASVNVGAVQGGGAQITGTIQDSNNPVRFAGSKTPEIVLLADNTLGGTVLYTVTATAVTSIPAWTGKTGEIVDLAEINQRFLYAEPLTGRVWFSNLADAATVGSSSFFTIEAEPDVLRGLLVVGDTIMALGARTIELWQATGTTVRPFLKRPGGVLNIGVISSYARALVQDVPFIVSAEGVVYSFENFRPTRISEPWLERRIRAFERANLEIRLGAYSHDGHWYLHLTGQSAVVAVRRYDYFYDLTTQTWHERDEIDGQYNYGFFVNGNGQTSCQNMTTGAIRAASSANFTHEGAEVKRVATAQIAVDKEIDLSQLYIDANPGVALSSGQGSAPLGMLRLSYDGRTFTDEIVKEIGAQGQWGGRVEYSGLGVAKPPQLLLEFSISDPIGYLLNGIDLNPDI